MIDTIPESCTTIKSHPLAIISREIYAPCYMLASNIYTGYKFKVIKPCYTRDITAYELSCMRCAEPYISQCYDSAVDEEIKQRTIQHMLQFILLQCYRENNPYMAKSQTAVFRSIYWNLEWESHSLCSFNLNFTSLELV